MASKKEATIALILIIISILFLKYVYATYTNVALPLCIDQNIVQKGTTIGNNTCSETNTQNGVRRGITARKNNPSRYTVNFSGNLIPAGSAISTICMNYSLSGSDTAVSNGLAINFWKASTSQNIPIGANISSFTTAHSNYTVCNNTIITTAADANALKIFFQLLGDATASDDIYRFEYIGVNISYDMPPKVDNISLINQQSITEGGKTSVLFSFVASDLDGVADLNDITAQASFNMTIGPDSTTRTNSSCKWIADTGGTANYSCTIDLFYFDMNGTWNINASVCDANICSQNITATFNLGVTPAMNITPATITFGSLGPGATNSTATDDPITITNTGNQNITLGNVRIKGIDLAGTTDGKTLGAGNFTVGTGSGSGNDECVTTNSSTQLVNNTATGIARAGLPRGNFSLSSTTANEQLFYCLRNAPLYLPIQDYNTNLGGAWTIDII